MAPSLNEANAALAEDSTFVPALMVKGAAQEQRNERAAAADTYSKVIAKLPVFTPAQKRLAALYAESPDTLPRAHELAMEARKSLPDDGELLRIIAVISYHRGEYAQAAQQLEASREASPLTAKEWFYLGMARWKQKSPTAKEALQSALSANVEEPLAAEARRVVAELEAGK
jgi:tetratricopeptide (TPR) repeat protein